MNALVTHNAVINLLRLDPDTSLFSIENGIIANSDFLIAKINTTETCIIQNPYFLCSKIYIINAEKSTKINSFGDVLMLDSRHNGSYLVLEPEEDIKKLIDEKKKFANYTNIHLRRSIYFEERLQQTY